MAKLSTLTFYTNPASRGRLTRWALEETGLAYDEVLLDFGTSMKSSEYLAINPMGKVPAVRHGDLVVTESVAIGLYLADLVPEKKLAPPLGSPERGSYYRWLLFLAGPLEAMLTAQQTKKSFADPVSAGYGKPDDCSRVLRDAVAGRRYLAGDDFTMADLYTAAYLGFYMQVGLLQPCETFSAFVQYHFQRPAWRKANDRDDALMKDAQKSS